MSRVILARNHQSITVFYLASPLDLRPKSGRFHMSMGFPEIALGIATSLTATVIFETCRTVYRRRKLTKIDDSRKLIADFAGLPLKKHYLT